LEKVLVGLRLLIAHVVVPGTNCSCPLIGRRPPGRNRPEIRDFASARIFFSQIHDFPVAFEKALGHIAPVAATQRPSANRYPRPSTMSGCSSGVEHNLAKVGVERSNRFTRSIFSKVSKPRFAGAF